MKPVKQTDTGQETGNCLQAAFASILELELHEVPDFGNMGDDWWLHLTDWFAKRNVQVHWSATHVPVATWHVASVFSPRFEGATHAVVCDPDMNIVHDPHPDVDDPSINSKPIGWYWFTVIDPAKLFE